MKKFVLIGALLWASFGWSAPFKNEYLVKYTTHNAYQAIVSMAASLSAQDMMTLMDHHPAGSYVKVDIAKKDEAKVLAQIYKQKGVQYIVPNFKLKAFSTPLEVNKLRDQWAIAKVQAEKAWQRAGNKGSRSVVVAVIDTGADYRHESLSKNAIPGYDFKEKDSDPMDKTSSQNPGHGTHCSGIIGATGLVDNGTIGISPEVSIMPVRFLGEDGSGSLDDGIKSIDFAIEKGVQVISASWGASVPESQAAPLIEAVKRASDKGVIFVAAAANDGKNNDNTDVYPANARFENTITVAASTSGDGKPSWSNFGRAKVDLASPGDAIMSTLPSNKYGNLSGTSMATPLVSGLVAFLKAQDPNLTGAQIKALLQTTGAKVNIETACNCRVDALTSVSHLLDKKMWITPAATTLALNDTLKLDVVNGSAPFTFTSSNAAITVDDSGTIKAAADGSAIISVKDSKGESASTLEIFVGKKDNGGGGEEPGDCPLGDPQMCQILCGIMPDLPFCKTNL